MPDITSPLLLARRERTAPVALLLLVVGVAAGALAATIGAISGALALSLGAAVWAARVDRRTGRIPDESVVAVALPAVAAGVFAGGGLDVVAGALVVAAPLLVLHLTDPSSLGFGDVKFGAALGGAVGLVEPRLGLVTLLVASAYAVATIALRGRSSGPFAPALVVGAVCSLAAAGPITSMLTGGTPSWR